MENAEAVFGRTFGNKARGYPGADDPRSDGQRVFPAFKPSFVIAPGSAVFTIGSCFARNVEKALVERGMDVPTAAYSAPHEEAPGQPNRILNQYNPATMLQCVRAAGQAADEAALYEKPGSPGMFVDPLLATNARAVTKERALERRQEINALYAAGLSGARTVVVTLGLVEAWYDNIAELYLNEAPLRRALKEHPGRWTFKRLDVAESVGIVRDLVMALGAGATRNIVLTVSPVPLQTTFSGGDAVTANAYSKAVLRVVAEEITQSVEGVDYFPSYEVVTSGGLSSYGEDQVHVRPVVVEKIIGRMVDAYCAPAGSIAAE